MEKSKFDKIEGRRFVLPSGSVVMVKSEAENGTVSCDYVTYFTRMEFAYDRVNMLDKNVAAGVSFTGGWFTRHAEKM